MLIWLFQLMFCIIGILSMLSFNYVCAWLIFVYENFRPFQIISVLVEIAPKLPIRKKRQEKYNKYLCSLKCSQQYLCLDSIGPTYIDLLVSMCIYPLVYILISIYLYIPCINSSLPFDQQISHQNQAYKSYLKQASMVFQNIKKHIYPYDPQYLKDPWNFAFLCWLICYLLVDLIHIIFFINFMWVKHLSRALIRGVQKRLFINMINFHDFAHNLPIIIFKFGLTLPLNYLDLNFILWILKTLNDLGQLIVASQQCFIKTYFEVIECEFWNFSGDKTFEFVDGPMGEYLNCQYCLTDNDIDRNEGCLVVVSRDMFPHTSIWFITYRNQYLYQSLYKQQQQENKENMVLPAARILLIVMNKLMIIQARFNHKIKVLRGFSLLKWLHRLKYKLGLLILFANQLCY